MIVVQTLSYMTRFLRKRVIRWLPAIVWFLIQNYGNPIAQHYLPAERRGDWQKAGSLRHFTNQLSISRINRVTEYGADSTGMNPTKNVLAFRAALADRSSSGVTVIYIPQGTYVLDSAIALINTQNTIISGAGSTLTRLLFNLDGIDNTGSITLLQCDTVGIENLYITRGDAANYGDNISVVNSRYSWVAGVESNKAVSSNVSIYFSTHIEVRGCCIHHAWGYGKGGMGYGVVIGGNATGCLIEDNIFYHLRHSVILSNGPFDNVIGYNYSTDPYTTEKYVGIGDWPADLCLHGHPDDFPGPYRNLFEGNLCAFMHADNAWYDNGPFNTFFRNRATYYGLKIHKDSDSQNVVANEVTDRDGEVLDLLWNAFNIESTDNFVLGNTNYDPDPDDKPSEGNFSADLSLYYDPAALPVYLHSLPYFPPFGAVDKDHSGGGTIPAKQRWDAGGLKTVETDRIHSLFVHFDPHSSQYPVITTPTTFRSVGGNGKTVIRFIDGSPGIPHLNIYTLQGQLVRTICTKIHPLGPQIIQWNGTDNRGQTVQSGKYVCVAAIGSTTIYRQLLLLP